MNIDRLGQIDLSLVKFISRKDGPRLRKDDVLFNNTNSPQLIGKTAWIGQDADWAFSNHMTRLRTPDALVSKFVAHQLHYLWMTGYFLRRCVKHVNQASVSSTALAATVPMTLPPLPEQHRIVAEIEKQFTRLDASVAALKRAQANLKRYRASVLKSACEGKLVATEADLARAEGRDYEPADRLLERILAERLALWEAQEQRRGKYKEPVPQDTSDLAELPEGWVWLLFDQALTSLEGGTSVTATDNPSCRRVLRSSAVRHGTIDLSDVRYLPDDAHQNPDTYITTGDLLFTRLSGSLEYVGNCVVVPELGKQRFEFPDRDIPWANRHQHFATFYSTLLRQQDTTATPRS